MIETHKRFKRTLIYQDTNMVQPCGMIGHKMKYVFIVSGCSCTLRGQFPAAMKAVHPTGYMMATATRPATLRSVNGTVETAVVRTFSLLLFMTALAFKFVFTIPHVLLSHVCV